MTGDVVVLPSVTDGVGVLEWRRPPNNYVDVAMLDGILEGIEAVRETGCRAVVLRSQGKHFCAGRDFSVPRERGDEPGDTYDRAARLFEVDLPVVAQIQGAAVGAGLGLAAVADFRLVSDRAYFWANFVKIGSHPGFGLTMTMPDLVGARRAAWMFATSSKVGAATALEWGLADMVVPESELAEATLAFASKIAAQPAQALRALKASLRGPEVRREFRAATDRELAVQDRLSG